MLLLLVPYGALMELTRRVIQELSDRVAAGGIAAHWDDVAAVLTAARACGAPDTVLSVLGDPAAPEIVRQRAYGRAATAVARGPCRPDVGVAA